MSANIKRKRGRPETAALSYSDLGPRIRHTKAAGALVSAVVVSYRPDPQAPQGVDVRGAHRVIIYDWLHAEGLLTDEQREAADRYLVRAEQADGAVDTAPAKRSSNGAMSLCLEDRIVAARQDLRRADAALGVDKPMVWEIVALNRDPPGGVPVVRFAAAMARLARMWGM